MLSATELRAAFAAREVSPVEMLAHVHDREELGAFITLDLERAGVEAKAAEEAYARGAARPLEGLPLAVKDLFDTAGLRTTYGSKIFANHVPAADAALVAKARDAGAIVVGKTLTHEFAWGITSVNLHFPPCRNPHDPSRVCGGSSGGSAVALATGQAALALGTDTGGSIRIPASFCGVSGLKPTYGRLSAAGVYPLARSLDHTGPMARTPEDVKLFYEALAGRAAPERAKRIAVCPDLHVRGLDPGIRRAFEHAVMCLDAEVIELSFERPERLQPTYVTIQNAEAALTHASLFPARRDEFGPDVAARIDLAQGVTLAEYAEATAERERIRSNFAKLFAAADLLITPIAAVAPELRESPDPQGFRDSVLPYTVPQDLAGLPACAVPVGVDDLGLPVGVQLTGPPWSEARVLTAAIALYEATTTSASEVSGSRPSPAG
jgi:aspartyl-tRNA(Asn)/glutamyl-tRNA(Gln) amidotransferase subunit A